jgi:hypothetical protein
MSAPKVRRNQIQVPGQPAPILGQAATGTAPVGVADPPRPPVQSAQVPDQGVGRVSEHRRKVRMPCIRLYDIQRIVIIFQPRKP